MGVGGTGLKGLILVKAEWKTNRGPRCADKKKRAGA